MTIPMTAANVAACFDAVVSEIESPRFPDTEAELLADPRFQQLGAFARALSALFDLLVAEEMFRSSDSPMGS